MNEADYISGCTDGCETVEEYRNALETFMRRRELFGNVEDMKCERLGHELLKFVDGIVAAHDEMSAEVDRLRAALKSVMKEYCSHHCDVEFGSESCRGSQCRMSEALAAEGGAE